MNISKFFGATNREAMRQVRMALGADALILSNKRVNGGVEILAADPTELENNESLNTAANQSPVNDNVTGLLTELKGSLEGRIDELLWSGKLAKSQYSISLFQNLLRFGFSTALVRAMIKVMPEQKSERTAINWARAQLIKNLPVLADENQFWQTGSTIALVGPTGVGKTTTVAKLAARFVDRYGADKLVLITTDTYRIGAFEQLKIYGDLLKVPVFACKDLQELQNIVQGVPADKTILIDNVGISQRDSHVATQASLLASAGRAVSRLLVLNAASHGDTLDEVARKYSHDGGTRLAGCIISKTDESTKLAAALDVAIRYRLNIHYVSNGQKVPENLLLANSKDLVDRSLYTKLAGNNLYAPSNADLSALLSAAQPEQTEIILEQQRRQKILLPRLLGRKNGQTSLADLQAAVKQIDDDILLADTYDLWQSWQNNDSLRADDLINHKHNVINGMDIDLKILLHNRQNMSQGAGSWLSTVCFDQNGTAIAALAQQAGLMSGWHTPNGVMAIRPTSQEAIFNQIHNENYLLQGKKLHVFDGFSQTLLAKLINQKNSFIVQSGARTRLYLADGSYVISALVNDLDWQPLNNHDLVFLNRASNLDVNKYAWWAAIKPIQISIKGQSCSMYIFSLQAINNMTAKPVKIWHALSSHDFEMQILAKALLLRGEYQSIMRNMVAHMTQSENSLLATSFYLAQCGLAALHLANNNTAHVACQMAAGMLGKTGLDSSNAYMALNKLYTLKEMLN